MDRSATDGPIVLQSLQKVREYAMKTDLRISVTKKMIKDALLRLLEHKQIDKIKVNELCEESGVNRATFYRHYGTLQDVLQEIGTDLIRAMPQPGQKLRNIGEARDYLGSLCTYIYQHVSIMKILIRNRTDEEMMQSITDFYRDYLDVYLDTLPTGRPDEDTIQIAITLLSGGSHCLMKQWVMGQIRKTPGELADILCNMIRLQGPFSLSCEN